jgi:hypothetical protein
MSNRDRDEYLEKLRRRHEALIDPFAHVLEEVFRSVPDVRLRVLHRMSISPRLTEGHFEKLQKDGKVGLQIASMIVRTLVRHITEGRSKEDAARILWRWPMDDGTGGWCLQDYLKGLPGIEVDLHRCEAAVERAQLAELEEEAKAKEKSLGPDA